MNYFELTDIERANLTDEQLDEYTKIALMEEGIVEVRKPIEPERSGSPAKGETYYMPVLKVVYDRESDFVFETHEEAEQFLSLRPIYYSKNYQTNRGVVETPSDVSVKTVQCFEKGLASDLDSKDSVFNALYTQYKTELAAYEDYLEKRNAVSVKINDDRSELLRKKYRSERLIEVWNDYVETCKGDQDMALTFLLKAYTESEIKEACRFTGTSQIIAKEKAATNG